MPGPPRDNPGRTAVQTAGRPRCDRRRVRGPTRAAVGIIAELNHHRIRVLDCLHCDGTGTVRLDPGRGNRPTRSGR
jgi:hypothetical protein